MNIQKQKILNLLINNGKAVTHLRDSNYCDMEDVNSNKTSNLRSRFIKIKFFNINKIK